MSRIKWTESMDRRIREMSTEGKTASEIAEELAVEKEKVYSRLAYLRQKGYVIGGADGKTMPSRGDDASAGKLNDLEKVMADTVRELTEERDTLAERLAIAERDFDDIVEKNANCLGQIAEQAETIEKLQRELEGEREALTKANKSEDELARTLQKALKEIDNQAQRERDTEKKIAALEARVKDLQDNLAEMMKIEESDKKRIGDMAERLDRAARCAGHMFEQMLVKGVKTIEI